MYERHAYLCVLAPNTALWNELKRGPVGEKPLGGLMMRAVIACAPLKLTTWVKTNGGLPRQGWPLARQRTPVPFPTNPPADAPRSPLSGGPWSGTLNIRAENLSLMNDALLFAGGRRVPFGIFGKEKKKEKRTKSVVVNSSLSDELAVQVAVFCARARSLFFSPPLFRWANLRASPDLQYCGVCARVASPCLELQA